MPLLIYLLDDPDVRIVSALLEGIQRPFNVGLINVGHTISVVQGKELTEDTSVTSLILRTRGHLISLPLSQGSTFRCIPYCNFKSFLKI